MGNDRENTLLLRANRSIRLGFAAVIVLMLFLTGTALLRLERIHESIREISEDHSVHTQLAHRMYDASRERGFLMFRVVYEGDPFLADEIAMRFRDLSLVFGQARQALLKEHLTPEERALLEKQRQAAEETMLQQDLVLGLVFAGNRDKAQETLAQYALPAQEGVLSAIDQLIKIQHQEVEQASKSAAAQERQAYVFLLIGTAVATLLSVGIAYYVQRKISGLVHGAPAKP